MNIVSILTLLILIEVKPNTLDVFPGFCVWFIYEISMFTLLITILIFAPLSLLIVSNYDNVVFYSLGGNEFDRFRFSFI